MNAKKRCGSSTRPCNIELGKHCVEPEVVAGSPAQNRPTEEAAAGLLGMGRNVGGDVRAVS